MSARSSGAAGRYVRHDLVSRGELADVYLGHDRVLDRPVNLKLIRALPEDDSARARLSAEVNAWARLQHPSLQRLWDADLHNTKPFIVTEFVEGTPLREVLSAAEVTAQQLARIGLGVAGALDVVHEVGLAHGAVSPDTIVIRGDGTAKLIGFALTRIAAHLGSGPQEPASAADDVRDLGAVLQQADAQVDDSEALGQRWRDLLVAMAADNPQHRPSALEAAAVLRSIVPRDDDPTVVLPLRAPGAHVAPRRFGGLRRVAAVAAAVAALFVGLDSWVLTSASPDSSRPPAVRAEFAAPGLKQPAPSTSPATTKSATDRKTIGASGTSTGSAGTTSAATSSVQLTKSGQLKRGTVRKSTTKAHGRP